MFSKDPPQPTHVPGTHKGEELAQRLGKEPGRGKPGSRGYRTARDSTSVNADAFEPIDPRMPEMPPA